MKREEIQHLIRKYADGNCSSEEKAIVESYFDKCQENEMVWHDDEATVKKRIFSKIEASIGKKEQQRGKVKHRQLLMKVAAGILLLIGCGVLWKLINRPPEMITVVTTRDERKTIMLPDGSEVTLNLGSSLSFPAAFETNQRKVSLQGEAYFQVFRNPKNPFLVHTSQLETKVLGTSFNVNAYENLKAVKVSVTSGKVQVSNKKYAKQVLVKNEQLLYNVVDQTMVKQYYNSEDDIAWKENILLLNDLPLETAAKILENWFSVSIVFKDDDVKSKRINGKFKQPKLENVLESLRFSIGIDYEYINQNKILIKNNPI